MATIRVGILGCGGMAGEHAKRFKRNADVHVAAVCDISEAITQRFVEKHFDSAADPPAMFTEPAAMYGSAKLDAVCIVTPHTMHFDHGVAALDAGCHVLMEKPMVTSADQAYALAEKVRSSGKVFVIGYNTPCTPAFQYLREVVRHVTLGRLEVVTGWLAQNWMRPTAGKWRQDPALSGGGQAYDSGAHLFNSLVWTVESRVAEVAAFVDHRGAPVDINCVASVRFENGVLASITIGGDCGAYGGAMALLFENGRIEVDGWMGQWFRVYDKNGEVKDLPLPEGATTPNDNFIDAILGRDEPRTNPEHGIMQSELMDAIYESARTGRSVRPKTRQEA